MNFINQIAGMRQNAGVPTGSYLPSIQQPPTPAAYTQQSAQQPIQPQPTGNFMDSIIGMRQNAGVMPQPGGGGGAGGINIPTNLYPSSQSTSSGGGSNSSNSNSFAGINWESPVSAGVLDQLLSSANRMPGLVDEMGNTIQGRYSDLMRQAMGPQGFQGTLNQMGNRGILNSSVTGSALANAQQQNAQAIGNQAWNSQLAQQQAQMQVPGLLGQLAALGQENTSQSSSRGSSGSSSQSTQSDPLAPYRLLVQNLLPQAIEYGV